MYKLDCNTQKLQSECVTNTLIFPIGILALGLKLQLSKQLHFLANTL